MGIIEVTITPDPDRPNLNHLMPWAERAAAMDGDVLGAFLIWSENVMPDWFEVDDISDVDALQLCARAFEAGFSAGRQANPVRQRNAGSNHHRMGTTSP